MTGTQDPIAEHLARMTPAYAEAFSEAEVRRHAVLAARVDNEHLVEVDAAPLAGGGFSVTVVALDLPGEFSLICGLLFAHGLSIREGHAFTYEPGRRPRKIVDVLHVYPLAPPPAANLWARYRHGLESLLARVQRGEQGEAQGELARRVAAALRGGRPQAPLYPIDIEIDNDASERYTILRIGADDTPGFLYELANAFALNGLHIARVTVETAGRRVRDTVYLADGRGRKVTAPEKQQELRAATVVVKHFTHLLPQSPNPESALAHFGEFLGRLFAQPNWPQELASLERPDVLRALARLLGVSDFLWDDFLRMQHANLFPMVRDVDALARPRRKAELQAGLAAALAEATPGEVRRAAFNAFKDREMFRADMRHILAHSRFGEFSAELTDLAETVVEGACRLAEEELHSRYGGEPAARLSVCALGKCGGRELGFASDIELLFVYESQGAGPVAPAEYYEALVRRFVDIVWGRREGIFQIDLRLRPYGSAGSLAVPLDSFRRYYAPDGPAWDYERQALVKLRPIAGDAALGEEIVALRDGFVYRDVPVDGAALRELRAQQVREYVAPGTVNAKYSPGGLVDVEYLVQALQIAHGHAHPQLRETNTRHALAALATVGLLPQEAYERLDAAYAFLRDLIDALRMVRGNARDLTVPPAGSEGFAFLARRLRYADPGTLSRDLCRHLQAVTALKDGPFGY